MMFTSEKCRIVSSILLDEDNLIVKREQLALIIKELSFLNLEQLIEISEIANQKIASFALFADSKIKQLRL